MRKKFIIILLLLLSIPFFCLDNTSDDWRENADRFRLDSLARDIVMADFNQLMSMAMALGLKEETSSDKYKTALAKYYGIELIKKSPRPKGDIIELRRAGELKMFKVVEEDEENLHILGRAKLILKTKDKDNKDFIRTIEADEIFINTKHKEITGIGNVYFKDNRLEYQGIQFYYNYDINQGILFKGRTKLLKGGDSGLEGAYFKGEKVVQTGEDDIILYKGMLTTCEEDNPHYYMKVSRLWISEKGEWGIINGVVHVGPVPFFYFPIYYHPKELIIYPAFGFRSRVGWYLNTTYYILGEKDEVGLDLEGTKNAISLINNRRKPQGLFSLTKEKVKQALDVFYEEHEFYEKYPGFKIYPKFSSLDFALRVFGDAYTNLGFYTGCFFYINAVFPNFPYKIYTLSDFAFSRRIWKDGESDLYVPYDPLHQPTDDNSGSFDNNTYYYLTVNPLSSPEMPFRSSQWFMMSGSLFPKKYIDFNYDIQFEYATDKNYFMDFYNRGLDFSYIDLLADTISYSIKSQDEEITGFETVEDSEVTSNKNDIYTYIKSKITPKNIPDLFGIEIIKNINVGLESTLKFMATDVSAYLYEDENYKEKFENADDPMKERYLLYSFTTPYVTYNMDGTILDYNAFGEMQDKIKLYKNKQANKEAIEKDNIKKDLYIYIDNIKNTDASKDDVEIDYMHLLPLFSEQIPVSQISDKKDEYKYNKVLIGDEDFTYKEEDVSDVDVTKEDEDKEAYRSKYFKISQINPNKQETSGIVKPIYFNLAYSLKEKITNTFSFDTTTDEAKYDTIQTLFKGNLDIDNIVKRFSVVNDLSFTLSGSLKLFEISGKSLWNMSPKLYINYNKYYDNMDIFKGDEKIQLTENARKSDFSIKYADSITNDLSFGVYRIAGTMIKTNLKINIFKFNELKQYNFSLLNSDNEGNETYEEYKDTHFYYNRVTYEKIETFQTTLTLSFNLLPEGNPHKLSMGIGPFVKWVIPSSDLSTLKNELWAKASGDVTTDGNNDILNEAKEYIYYRSKGLNLNDKINDFFWGKDFWIGAKYYRKMLSNFTYSLKYSYTKNSITVVDISNSLIFKLENIGVFSNLAGLDRYHSVFPDDTFNISFFNQMIKYTLGIAFKKEVNNKAFDNLDDYDKKLDEYNIITMTKAHTFNFKIPGTLFKAKLPTGDWLSLSTTLSFKWDRTLSTRDESTDRVESNWDDKSEYNYFFLDSQSIKLYLLMNIFYIELNFKSFNFTGTGYGFELDNGKIDIGYKITQIPIFWRFFKLTFEPKVSYNFVVKHNQYYDGSTLKEFNTSYYSNNKLSFSLNVDLVIGEGTKFETKIHFGVSSENKKIYRYYTDTGVKDFFVDLGKSFRFDDIQLRRDSPFNLSLVVFSITHKLCDWELNFKYMGQPEKDINTNKYNWENTFEFTVEWKIDTKNQLMKMFNKSNIKEVYQKGEWEQPVVSLDPDD